MFSGRSPRDARPDLLKPHFVTFSGDNAKNTRGHARASVPSGLPLHENELNVILDYRIRLIRFSKEAATVSVSFISRVSNLVPNNRRKVAKAYSPAMLLY